MAMAGAEIEQVGPRIGIADDKIGVAVIHKTNVEFEEFACSLAYAAFNDGTVARRKGDGLNFDAGGEARSVDDQIRLCHGWYSNE